MTTFATAGTSAETSEQHTGERDFASQLERETGIEPATPPQAGRLSAWKADVPLPLPPQIRAGNFRSETGCFGHLTQALLSI